MTFLTANDNAIYREELSPQLPRRLFDAHVHVFDHSAFPPGFAFPAKTCYQRFGGVFTLAQWRELVAELLPEQQLSLNCFGTPHAMARREAAPRPDNVSVFAMTLLSPADPVDTVRQRLADNRLIGCKPYLNYAAEHTGKNPDQVEILDMFSDGQLELIDRLGLAVTLHIPRPGRLADPVNQRQMVEICQRCPRATFIFAHIGRAYFLRNVVGQLDRLAECPNAWLDTAMVNHQDVLKYTFDHFPTRRILFGSDAPIAFLRGKSVEINHQYAYLMAEDFRIGTAIYDTEHVVDFTTFFYEQLRALLSTAPPDSRDDILFGNANNLFTRLAAALGYV
ncbi:MAG: amidohydrolase family protein [Lentisphaeria bacterium]|nr:amidohydrolase family protein [Lentisphaeria bacterium]